LAPAVRIGPGDLLRGARLVLAGSAVALDTEAFQQAKQRPPLIPWDAAMHSTGSRRQPPGHVADRQESCPSQQVLQDLRLGTV
jgi:hypothetical protein